MNDLGLFFLGCFVSSIILAAVGLLLYGAANEPGSSLLPERTKAREPRPTTLKATPASTQERSEAAERVAG